MIHQMLAIWSLVPLPILKPAWTSGSSRFMYCWSLDWRILSITLLACEMSAIVRKFGHSLGLPFLGIGMKTDLFQSCGHCWVFQICWHIECSTFTATSFRIWNSSTRIPSHPLALALPNYWAQIIAEGSLASDSTQLQSIAWGPTQLGTLGSDPTNQGTQSLDLPQPRWRTWPVTTPNRGANPEGYPITKPSPQLCPTWGKACDSIWSQNTTCGCLQPQSLACSLAWTWSLASSTIW